jgi:hypothetical protein
MVTGNRWKQFPCMISQLYQTRLKCKRKNSSEKRLNSKKSFQKLKNVEKNVKKNV